MKEIRLTRGFYTMVDDEDFEYLNQFKWQTHFDRYNYYAVRTIYKPKRRICMHRIIMETPIGMEVDHKDHNGLNNQKYNLRNCSHKSNMANATRKHKSIYRGVSILKKGKYTGRINAQININGKRTHLGTFNNPVDAAIAYNKAAKEIYGDFAILNDI